jgi:hypothetical protein
MSDMSETNSPPTSTYIHGTTETEQNRLSLMNERTYDRLGNDPYIGRRLAHLLYEAGAEPRRNSWIFFGSCSGNPNFAPLAQNMIEILRGARETILAQSFLDQAYLDQSLQALVDWRRRPDAALWYAICWAEGVRPI